MNKRVILFIGCLILLRFSPMLFGKTIFFGDNYSLIIPGKIFTANWLRQGIVPLWNPFIFAGIPWFGNINESILYPSTLVFILFHPAIAVNLTVISHLLLTGIGMYLYVRKTKASSLFAILGAVLWVFSTQVTGSINNLTTLQSITWIPWILWASTDLLDTQFARLGVAFFISLQMLGGYPQYTFYTVLLAALLKLFEIRQRGFRTTDLYRLVRTWFMAGICTLGLCACILIPFLHTMQKSTRTIQTGSQASRGAVRPDEVLKVVFPYIFEQPQVGMKWGPSWNGESNQIPYIPWIGIIVVASVFISKKRKSTDYLYGSIILMTFLFSFGDSFIGFRLFQTILPFFKATRGPNLILPITTFVSVLWVTDALARFNVQTPKVGRILKTYGVTVVILTISLFLISLYFEPLWKQVDLVLGHKLSSSSFHTVARDRIIFDVLTNMLVLNTVYVGLALWCLSRKRIIFLILILAFEMHSNTKGLLFFAPNHIYPSKSEITERKSAGVVQAIGHERVLIRNGNSPYTDFGTYMEALTVRSPFSDSYIGEKELTDFANLQRMSSNLTPVWNMVYGVKSLNGYTSMIPLDLDQSWNHTNKDPSLNSLPEITPSDPQLHTWGVSGYLVDTWFPGITTPASIPLTYEQGSLRLYQEKRTSRFQFSVPQTQIVSLQETPNEITMTIHSQGSGTMRIADRFDSDWQATVNGRTQSIRNSSGLREISVPPGSSTIQMRYVPRSVFQGFLLTGITILSLGLYWFVTRRRVITK